MAWALEAVQKKSGVSGSFLRASSSLTHLRQAAFRLAKASLTMAVRSSSCSWVSRSRMAVGAQLPELQR